MISDFVIVVCESLNYPQCERTDLKSITVVKDSNMQKMLENLTRNVQDLKDFSEEQ